MMIELSIDEAKRLLGGTVRSISRDETRRALNSLLLECNGLGVVAVSSDGHRLARFTLLPMSVPTNEAGSVLLPLAIVLDVQKAIKKHGKYAGVGWVRIDTATRTVSVSTGVSFTYPDHDGVEFPPYRQVIPTYELGRPGRRFIGINADYLTDAQAAFHDACGTRGGVTLEFGESELDPITVRGSDRLGSDLLIVVMPMRTDEPDSAKAPVKEAAREAA